MTQAPRSRLCHVLLRGLLLGALTALLTRPAPTAPPLAKFEPLQGCYIGAFIEKDFTVQGKIGVFEALTKKKHASYFTYVGYGQPFPGEWVDKVKASGAAPHIAFEPNGGLEEVLDSDYLRNWARDAARARCPIFLRWASEMNGPWTRYSRNPPLYVDKYRLIASVMKQEAPNVAMVWTPFAEPHDQIDQYYPGDEYVDWVGVNIYSVYVHNGDPLQPAYQEDPIAALRYIYDNYSDRKPIHISEFAATIFCRGTDRPTPEFAIDKMTRFYSTIRREYPRVKSINWFCLDTIRAGLANNNYSLLDDGRVLAAYRKLVSDDYFLSKVDFDPTLFNQPVRMGTTLGGASSGSEDTLTGIGAIAANLDKPMLRGIKNGDVLHDDLALRAQLPLDLIPEGLMWQLDGHTVALTNTPPYRVAIDRARIAPGHHTARLLVIARDADHTEHLSPEVSFEMAP